MSKNRKFVAAAFLAGALCLVLTVAAAFGQVQMTGLATTDISITIAKVSWITDKETSDNRVEVRIKGSDSLSVYRDNFIQPTGVHLVELINLKVGTDYEYRIGSGGTVWDNEGNWYSFKTFADIDGAPLPTVISGRLVDKSGQPLQRALVRSTARSMDGRTSVPLVTLTAAGQSDPGDNGYWLCNLSNFMDSNIGGHLNPSSGDMLSLEYRPNFWTSDTASVVIGDNFPQSVGQKVIDVFDPSQGIRGDLDGNGKIDIFDLLQELKVLGGTLNPSSNATLAFASDVDGNGHYDVFDLLALLKKLSGKVS